MNMDDNKKAEAESLNSKVNLDAEDFKASEPPLVDDEKNPSLKEAPQPEAVDELKEWKSKAAYLAAEIENMQKRSIKEKADLIRFGNENLLQKMFPVLDNLVLALKAAQGSEAAGADKLESMLKGLTEGVQMTLKQFEGSLTELGVEFIDAVEKSFDPTVHEAIGQVKKEDLEDDVIVEEYQRGYKLNGRVVRAAKVIVNKK